MMMLMYLFVGPEGVLRVRERARAPSMLHGAPAYDERERSPRGGVGVSRQMSFCTFRVRVCVYARLGYRYASGLGPPCADGLQGQRSHRVQKSLRL